MSKNIFTPPAVFSLHWLSFTIYCDERKAREILTMWELEDTLENTNHGGNGFRRIHQGLNGLKFYTQPVSQRKTDESTKDYGTPESWKDVDKINEQVRRDELREKSRQAITYCLIQMPGECVSTLSPERIREVFNYIISERIKINITRLDLAFDTQIISAKSVWHAIMADRIVTRASRDTFERYLNYTGTNDGISIGSRDSLQYLRIYTKVDEKSIFEGKFVRFELELHDERSTHCLLNLLVKPLHEWSGFCLSILRGYVEFQTKWWQKLVGESEKIWLRLEVKSSSVEKIETWLYDQVATSLATFLIAKRKKKISPGGEITYDLLAELQDLIKTGQRRLKEKHRIMIDKYDPNTKPSHAIFNLTSDQLIENFMQHAVTNRGGENDGD